MIYLYEETAQLSDGQLFLLEQRLPEQFRQRAERMRHRGSRIERVIGYTLLLRALFMEYGCRREEIAVGTGKYGKPALLSHPDIFFNLSHSGGKAGCAVGTKENGMDIQKHILFREELKRRICCASEAQRVDAERSLYGKGHILTEIWAMKEAYLKKRGTGLREDLSTLETETNSKKTYCLRGERIHIWQREEFVIALCAEEELGEPKNVTLEELMKDT